MIDTPEIRMVALDLDGTTLNNRKEFAERTIRAFHRAKDQGVYIVIATGRAFNSLPEGIFNIKGIEYVVMSNGAKIYDVKKGEIIYENFLPEKSVKLIVDVIRREHLMVEAFVGGKAYISRNEYDAILDGRITTRPLEYVKKSRTPVDNVESVILENIDTVENISINYLSDEIKQEKERILKEIPDVTLTSSFPLNNEIGGTNTSKAEALNFLMNRLGLDRLNLMACGDSPNDGAMLDLAQVAVVVENGEPVIKDKADFITKSNDDDGVAIAIEKFALK